MAVQSSTFDTTPQLVPLKVAAKQLGVSYPFLYAAHQAKAIKTVSMGTKIMIPVAEVARLMNEGIPAFRPSR